MEDIFNKEQNNVEKYKLVRIERYVVDRLKKLNKGSPNKAIRHLLNLNPDKLVTDSIKELDQRVENIEDKLSRVMRKIGVFWWNVNVI